jgi:outer membrane protein assembly factor BamA
LKQFIHIIFLLSGLGLAAQNKYEAAYMPVDKNAGAVAAQLALKTSFAGRAECAEYLVTLPALLRTRGYITASLDSIVYDSTGARIWLYAGELYKWARIRTAGADDTVLRMSGWDERRINRQPLEFERIFQLQQKMLGWYLDHGYPFARVSLDSIRIEKDEIEAVLVTEKGQLHVIDSIRLYGKLKVSKALLQRHLGIMNGSLYKKSVLQNISRKLLELPYVQEQYPANLTMLPGSSVLNLYLAPKKSSQINILLGLIPAPNPTGLLPASNKLLITGDANLLLNNSLAQGETIGLIYQQLAAGSPRLNVLYKHPFIFRSAFGVDASFEMYKRDSAWLNLDVTAGIRYNLGATQSGRLFFQHLKTNTYPDTSRIRFTRRLPDNLDVKVYNLGLQYDWNNTDYRRNPRSGNELSVLTAFGTKKIIANGGITELPDEGGFKFASLYDSVKRNTYQFKLKLQAARYFRLSKSGVLKAAVNGGLLLSQNYFRNELFQVGGFKLLRGFDEESQFCNQYTVATAEYRVITGLDSYFFVFADGGYTANYAVSPYIRHSYFGTGLGLSFLNKAGLFNISFAVGTRDDIPFGLKQSKIHFGYVNVF